MTKTLKRFRTLGDRRRSGVEFKKPSRTKQSMAEDCDINVIMARFQKTGQAPFNSRPMSYQDLSILPDSYHAALNLVIAAEDSFNALPSHIRDRFKNNPKLFLEFVDNPDNFDEGVELGLFKPSSKPSKSSDKKTKAEYNSAPSSQVEPAESSAKAKPLNQK